MDCEMCGRDVDRLSKVEIEGSILGVCPSCAKFGKRISPAQPVHGSKKDVPSSFGYSAGKVSVVTEPVLIDRFGSTIVSARERKGLSLRDLALKINEQESYLDRIEKEKTTPEEKVVRKLEKFLGIVLYDKSEVEQSVDSRKKGQGLSLGDFLEEKKD